MYLYFKMRAKSANFPFLFVLLSWYFSYCRDWSFSSTSTTCQLGDTQTKASQFHPGHKPCSKTYLTTAKLSTITCEHPCVSPGLTSVTGQPSSAGATVRRWHCECSGVTNLLPATHCMQGQAVLKSQEFPLGFPRANNTSSVLQFPRESQKSAGFPWEAQLCLHEILWWQSLTLAQPLLTASQYLSITRATLSKTALPFCGRLSNYPNVGTLISSCSDSNWESTLQHPSTSNT